MIDQRTDAPNTSAESDTGKTLTCGIAMPISASSDYYSQDHWVKVKESIMDALSEAGFQGRMVYHANEVGVIQKRIIQNLYENPVVVCDVSSKNPQVMFELGMRLAFDKPIVIIKDERTESSFDISPVAHVPYVSSLLYSETKFFKKDLAKEVRAAYDAAKSNPDYSPFLKQFGNFKVAALNTAEVPLSELVLDELISLQEQAKNFQAFLSSVHMRLMVPRKLPHEIKLGLRGVSEKKRLEIVAKLLSYACVKDVHESGETKELYILETIDDQRFFLDEMKSIGFVAIHEQFYVLSESKRSDLK